MMILKDEQFDLIAKSSKEKYVLILAEILRSEIDSLKDLSEDQLKSEINCRIKKASRYGFIINKTISTYVVSSFIMGENFDSDFNEVKKILTSNLSEEEKSENLENWVSAIFNELNNK